MNSADFITNVGPQYLNDAFGTSSGTDATASTEYFAKLSGDVGGFDAERAGRRPRLRRRRHRRPRDRAGRQVRGGGDPGRDPQGHEPRRRGRSTPARTEFAKALQLIKDGKPISYEGVIGPVTFDQYGDITGPFRLWRIQNGEVTTVGEMGVDEVNAIKAKVAQ